MPVHNADIAAIFDEIADLLEIRADNPFRIRAYRNAAHRQRLGAQRGWLQRGNVLNTSDRNTLRTRLNAGGDATR